jgi:ribosomal protein S12 methylthiotransferase accessory factor
MPNYTATLPGTSDLIWVYSGKGRSLLHAKASALMEAIERYSSFSNNYEGTLIRGSYVELSRSYMKVLHPDEVLEPTRDDIFDEKEIMDFVSGFDVLNREEVLVPAQIAFSRYTANHQVSSPFLYSHTNGLASGNTMEEAICHALCEVIERDAVSIADLCASYIPYTILERIGRSFDALKRHGTERLVDDPTIYSDINIRGIKVNSIKSLLEKFDRCNITLLIKDITQKEIGIPTFVASSAEWITTDYGFFAKGYGTHPDAELALIRAITEMSQTRAVNIQGSRDDLKKIRYEHDDEIQGRKWQFMYSLRIRGENTSGTLKKEFSEISSSRNMDILDDIQLILNSLIRAGLHRAIIVDLTNPSIGVPVVRAIVPGLETYEVAKLFTRDGALMGKRASDSFKRAIE